MRILLVSEDIPYPNMGGLAKHVLNLARALVRAGHHVDLMGNTEHPISVCGEEGEFGGGFFCELSGHHAGWKEPIAWPRVEAPAACRRPGRSG